MSPVKIVLRWYTRWFFAPRDDFSSSFAYRDRLARSEDYRARPCFADSLDFGCSVRLRERPRLKAERERKFEYA